MMREVATGPGESRALELPAANCLASGSISQEERSVMHRLLAPC